MKDDTTILLVEDDQAGRETIERALTHHDIRNPLHVVDNAGDALAELRQEERPGIVLIDVAQPSESWVGLLREIKGDTALKTVPVIVLTSSREEQERLKSFELGVAGYILKPAEFEDFARVVKTIIGYWSLSEVPRV